ncbi:MAG: hypothetical protein HZB19_17315 [Chloroflexi bacterium]|nr:hypothetical protein [Chloroflexota bacterium]
MQFVIAFLKKLPLVPIGALIVGLLLGLGIGWSTKEFKDADPSYLRADLQEDYLRMAIDSFRLNQDPNLAVQRWDNLGLGATDAYNKVQADPRAADPAVVRAYGELIARIKESSGLPTTPEAGGSSMWKTILLVGGVVALVVFLGVAGVYLWRLLRKRGGGEPTPVMQAAEISKHAEKTNFEQLGLAPPITQTMTTYVLGDDLYDESFSIDTQGGEFLGEYGVGVSEAIGVGDPKKVTALEIWLFDKNDIKTATKVLMSEHAFNDAGIRSRLEPKGELVQVEPQAQILLETATLQLLATVVDLEYGRGSMPQNSYFERITLELAIWPKGGG